MAELTNEQIRFLKEQKIDPKFVFNAEGLNRTQYRAIMKDLNKLVAYNTPPCKKEGHTLKTRSGHCCQCNTAVLGFQKRNDSAGIVYIAGSLKSRIIKVGFTKAVEIRSISLNYTKYAGCNDWKILYALNSKSAGKIETKSNSLLHAYASSRDYEHDGHWQDSYETYHCSYSKAKEFVEKAYSINKYEVEIEKNIKTDKYEFKNLTV